MTKRGWRFASESLDHGHPDPFAQACGTSAAAVGRHPADTRPTGGSYPTVGVSVQLAGQIGTPREETPESHPALFQVRHHIDEMIQRPTQPGVTERLYRQV